MTTAEETLVDEFIEFYRNDYQDDIAELTQNYPEKRSLQIDWRDLYQYNSDLADDYISKPEQIREYAEEAVRLYDHQIDVSLGQAHVRISNIPDRKTLSEIRSQHLNTLISVYGTVDSTSSIESQPEELAFECQRCGTLTYMPQARLREEPHECLGCERQGPFRVDRDQSTYVDGQTIRLQERLSGHGNEEDIESIVIRLEDDLVGKYDPGDHVIVTGVLRLESDGEYNNGSISDKFIEAHSITSTTPYEHIELSEEDKREIVELSTEEDIIERITGSIAPSVHGHDQVKYAIALQMFGGVPKTLPDDIEIRGDIHVLLVGDPGTSKSVLLNRSAQLAPRAVSASGKETTAVGLTAAAAPSKNSNHADPWAIEGGALVLANQGLACLDDFTNLSTDAYQALHGVLEEQDINLSKATRTRSLPANTSVLAAGNPEHERFDEYEPVAPQLDVPPGLLSQFDLLFTITDQPDPDKDQEVAQHILQTNYIGEVITQNNRTKGTDEQVDTVEIEPELETELLRKYIAYVRQDVFPTISDEARETLREFYVDLRSQGEGESQAVPVTARKLEGLVRLAEANARMRLSETVEQADAERVTELVKSSLADIGVKPENKPRPDQHDSASDVIDEKREREEIVKEIISDIASRDGGAAIEDILEKADTYGIDAETTDQVILNLKQKGEIYEPAENQLRSI